MCRPGQGLPHVAFVTDAYARRSWLAVTSTDGHSPCILDAIEQFHLDSPTRRRTLDLKDVISIYTDRGSQYTSIRFSELSAEAGIQPSVGAVGSPMTMH